MLDPGLKDGCVSAGTRRGHCYRAVRICKLRNACTSAINGYIAYATMIQSGIGGNVLYSILHKDISIMELDHAAKERV